MSPSRSARLARAGRLCGAGLLALALGGCAQEMGDLEQFVQQAKAAAPRRIEPLPEIQPHETFKYEAAHLRDPFEEIMFHRPGAGKKKQVANAGPKPDLNRPKEALEAFPLDALRMVGILEQDATQWALIRSSDGTIHRVTTGNHMGQNYGKIIRISETEVELMEIVPDGLGNYTERRASLAISE
ncbi:MAG: pilus assembly protein PilP [Gammaproteobacteria bacterium]|nr:pilus assembly protein PilP [Gammaproteobacteria bacterium]NIR97134.1 pilus assembly protein PilP [Gammaproteobacteria bacterium]NIT62832.1 pilus assembly protein PilP [Gammaproteobacteria bacterium]NIV19796.1 pilus assembly protein PilP [Gammaproteobacteria bacterium]NIX11329.1 pilus assembly protein PilP [Gammaproteobacteria bacterium]